MPVRTSAAATAYCPGWSFGKSIVFNGLLTTKAQPGCQGKTVAAAPPQYPDAQQRVPATNGNNPRFRDKPGALPRAGCCDLSGCIVFHFANPSGNANAAMIRPPAVEIVATVTQNQNANGVLAR